MPTELWAVLKVLTVRMTSFDITQAWREVLYYHSVGVEAQIPHVGCADTFGVGWASLMFDGDGLPNASLSLL